MQQSFLKFCLQPLCSVLVFKTTIQWKSLVSGGPGILNKHDLGACCLYEGDHDDDDEGETSTFKTFFIQPGGHHHHHHQSLNREDRWGTTDDSATSFLHFPCSSLPSGTCRTPGLSISWCCLPTSSSVSLVFFPLSLCLARWFWPDPMNGKHDHTTAVCVSVRSSGLHMVQLPAGSWHGLPRWQHSLCMRCVASSGSTSFPWLVFFFAGLPGGLHSYCATVSWPWTFCSCVYVCVHAGMPMCTHACECVHLLLGWVSLCPIQSWVTLLL